ncbi:DUF5522 domain-containing protein [Agarivorans sp. TSD2052]|uniref:DUF5522 domain-containing protein n=1 Tax=Agarivorans sp. TSD2052 TaxID=2937286 RepID=UPI002010A875|nr:DUF5522 domain-containing protein [Agarivorans sp. TSD2052]UPW18097.1 DUF5522 domain-containing protein [Agarivorans sp. TSD2052]
MSKTRNRENQQLSSNCPSCGTELACSADIDCWCMSMPALLPVSANIQQRACYCSSCLSKKLGEKLQELIANTPHRQMLEQAARYHQAETALQAHIDYTMVDGLMVFSAWYHLKRGSCCGNGCKHCPYPQ